LTSHVFPVAGFAAAFDVLPAVAFGAGAATAVDPLLVADGVDALAVVFALSAARGSPPHAESVRVHATQSRADWSVVI
jgi:hypothetical protein